MTTSRLSSVFVCLAVVASFAAAPGAEAARRPINRNADTTKFTVATSTTANFFDRRIWVPGSWTLQTTDESATFTRKSDGAVVNVQKVTLDVCHYQVIRQKLLKLWEADVLTQDQARIEHLVIGTSKYRGYKWVEPTEKARAKHWCLPQDGKFAAEVSAPLADDALVKFIDGNLMLQLALRRSR